MNIFKILGFIFIAAVLCLILKANRPEYALAVSIIAVLAVFATVLKSLVSPLSLIEQKIEKSGIESDYLKLALKALGIGYITSFIAESCRDAGQNSLALKAELAGKCAIFILSVPLILNILETALGFTQ